jgi:uncharacterized protein (TIGR03032 family)
LDQVNSFVPRWKPPFITGYSPNDRCHLNGVGMVDGKPKFVTALGETNTPTGWRANKKDGGILMDVPSGEIITRNLSMPHSPRWHNGQLWVLESGKGTLSVVDLRTGKPEAIATVPGFTRGLDFFGPLAFIGLSQVRETAVFSGIPITEQNIERNSGVWVINIQTALHVYRGVAEARCDRIASCAGRVAAGFGRADQAGFAEGALYQEQDDGRKVRVFRVGRQRLWPPSQEKRSFLHE